jgi:hypothetical protein
MSAFKRVYFLKKATLKQRVITRKINAAAQVEAR